MISGIAYWLLVIVLAACLVTIATIMVREFALPWYRKRQEIEYDDILKDDFVEVEDDISIILAGTVTQKDLQKTINILKKASAAVKRTEQKVAALKKINGYKDKIKEGNGEIKKLTAAMQPTNQQP